MVCIFVSLACLAAISNVSSMISVIQKSYSDGSDSDSHFSTVIDSGSEGDSGKHDESKSNSQSNESKYRHVSCPDVLARSKDDDFYDPNKDLDESPKRHTITSPPFWISLHQQWFDRMRWGSIMLKGNYYETGLTEVFKSILLNNQTSSTPGLVIDVGMNIGWFTLWSRKFNHTVASFEPNPVMHVRVCESLALNGWDKDDSVRIYPYGVANQEGMMNLTTGNNPGGSSFHEDRLAKKFRKSIPVNVVRIDDVARQEGWLLDDNHHNHNNNHNNNHHKSTPIPIHLMKIDVEGYENFVVKGGLALIQSKRISNIIVENSILEEAGVVELLHEFYQSGYKVHALLSVNGDDLKVNAEEVNREISMIPSSSSRRYSTVVHYDQSTSPHIHYLYTRTLNMWWVRREEEGSR